MADWSVHAARDQSVIAPRQNTTFTDPILKAPRMEALHTFNPAADRARRKSLCALPRGRRLRRNGDWRSHVPARPRQGLPMAFTSRAWAHGIFPAKDKQQSREWPGGVEDPRLVEREDGTYVLTYTQWNRKTYSVGIARPRDWPTLDQTRPRVSKCGERQICPVKVQIGRHRYAD